jgi:hypothetical protein
MFMRPSLPLSYFTPAGHFRIHYSLSGFDAVDSIGYVYKIGAYLEHSWTVYIDSMGYLKPPNDGVTGGDSLYDVYLDDLGSYGMTWPEDDILTPWFHYTSYIEIENDFDGVYENDDPEGPVAGAMKVTCAHEFHHAIQYGLRGNSMAWLAEMTSTAMEDRLYPYVNDYVWLVDYLMDSPQLPITWSSTYHMYGLAIFGQYFYFNYGDSYLHSVWDTMRFIGDFSAMQDECISRGTTLGWEFARFSARALLTGSRDAGLFPDGPAFDDMSVEETHSSYPASGSPGTRPYGYGASYIVFNNFGLPDSDLMITFDGSPSAQWNLIGIWKSGDSTVFIEQTANTSGHADIRVPFANRSEFVALTAVPVGDTTVQYAYTYSAELVPNGIEETARPARASISAYPNPFNSAVTISVGARHAVPVQIEIFDIAGKRIFVSPVGEGLVPSRTTGELEDCPYEIVWRPSENIGSGVYFARIGATGDSKTIRIIYLK